mmetsp:Transcript_24174/g.52957  ORF Transcript_24174/g.52957 Transcript_24174/m.52957 type:complete len:82 (-) Transcript_24174:42-287(-)
MILQLLMGPTNEENRLLVDADVDVEGGWEAHLLDKKGPILEISPRIIVLGSLLSSVYGTSTSTCTRMSKSSNVLVAVRWID